MQVFVSWSGVQSNAVAVALRNWLPKVLAQKVSVFVSSEDIEKGARGLSVIATELDAAKFGVIVVTPTNQHSPWINFEAGAIGKSVEDGRVAPLLVGISDGDLDGPLKQFQNTASNDRAAVLALVMSINRAHPDPTDEDTVQTLFEAHWASLNISLESALSLDSTQPEARESSDILDEVLTTVRSLQREVARISRTTYQPKWVSDDGSLAGLKSKYRATVWGGVRVGDKIDTNEELLSTILHSVGGRGLSWSRTGLGLDFLLSDDTPELEEAVERDIQGLARNQRLHVVLRRSDGSSTAFDSSGRISRTLPSEEATDVVQTRPETVDLNLPSSDER